MKNSYTIPRNLLDGLEAFLRVAERRSFREAAEDLGVSPSAISQTVRQLEERIGVPLFIRTTRSVGLTEAGALFHAQAAPAFASLVNAWEGARTYGGRPAGLLRLNMPRSVVPLLIEPIIADFCDQYPDVDVEVTGEDALIDLAASGHDAGRGAGPNESGEKGTTDAGAYREKVKTPRAANTLTSCFTPRSRAGSSGPAIPLLHGGRKTGDDIFRG
jgi:DNA-binding transcriptional LysR family regulator